MEYGTGFDLGVDHLHEQVVGAEAGSFDCGVWVLDVQVDHVLGETEEQGGLCFFVADEVVGV